MALLVAAGVVVLALGVVVLAGLMAAAGRTSREEEAEQRGEAK